MALRLAFGCKAGVGKSTAVDYLMQKHGGVELSFAKPLKNILLYAQQTCGFKENKDRGFLQWVGTDWARSKDENVWIHHVKNEIETHPNKNL